MFVRLSILTSFKIHYLSSSCVGSWHSDPLILCVGTWHSDPLHVSERDTPIPYMCRYVTLRSPTCVGTWHSDPLILCVGTWHSDPLISFCKSSSLLYSKASSLIMYIKVSFQDLGFNIFIMLILSQSHNHIITLVHQSFFYTKTSSSHYFSSSSLLLYQGIIINKGFSRLEFSRFGIQ